MDLPYLECLVGKKRQLRLNDTIILYDSNNIVKFNDSEYNIKKALPDNIRFIIIDNITENGILDNNFIKIKPVILGDVSLNTDIDIILKTHIKNIRQILSINNTDSSGLKGGFPDIRINDSIVNHTFDKDNFPNYSIDNVCEQEDVKLIDLYCKNISKYYNIPEIESELRTFQNMDAYGGITNTITEYQFNKIKAMSLFLNL